MHYNLLVNFPKCCHWNILIFVCDNELFDFEENVVMHSHKINFISQKILQHTVYTGIRSSSCYVLELI